MMTLAFAEYEIKRSLMDAGKSCGYRSPTGQYIGHGFMAEPLSVVQQVRRKRLGQLITENKTQEHLASILDVTPSYLSQLNSGHRPISEKTARRFERVCGKRSGWMDFDSSADYGLPKDWDPVLEVLASSPEEKTQTALKMMRALLDISD